MLWLIVISDANTGTTPRPKPEIEITPADLAAAAEELEVEDPHVGQVLQAVQEAFPEEAAEAEAEMCVVECHEALIDPVSHVKDLRRCLSVVEADGVPSTDPEVVVAHLSLLEPEAIGGRTLAEWIGLFTVVVASEATIREEEFAAHWPYKDDGANPQR